jgi:hypothetical protein
VLQLSPPLIADSEQFEEIGDILRGVLREAAERIGVTAIQGISRRSIKEP